MQQCVDFQLGPTIATLHPISWYDIPVPTTSPFMPYGVIKTCGDMSLKGFGFAAAVWTWLRIGQQQLQEIFEFFTLDTDASVQVAVATYKDIGSTRELGTYIAQMYRPIDGTNKAIVSSTYFWYTNISLQFKHLVEA